MKVKNINLLILLFIIIIFIHISVKEYKYEQFTIYKESMINSNIYKVQNYNKESQEAADLLGKINILIKKIRNYMVLRYPNDERVIRMKNRLSDMELVEPEHRNDESAYTINKGELMGLCLRSKDDKEFYDMKMMSFVVIHELAHVMSISEGHTSEFMDNFKFILKTAEEGKIYKPVNYENEPVNYCGVDVTHNPFYNTIN